MQTLGQQRILSAKHTACISPCLIVAKLHPRCDCSLNSNTITAVASARPQHWSVAPHPSALLVPATTLAVSVLLTLPAAVAAAESSVHQQLVSRGYPQPASNHPEQLQQQRLASHGPLAVSYGSVQWAGFRAPALTQVTDGTGSSSGTHPEALQTQYTQLEPLEALGIASVDNSNSLQSSSLLSNSLKGRTSSISRSSISSSLELVENGSSSSGYSSLPPIPQTFPELPKLKQPQIYQEVLPNGLKVFLLEDKEVPLTRGSILMEGGQVSSPPDKVGLASIAAAVQRSGGSKSHPADVIDERLEDLAAAIEASAGQQATTIDFQCMSEDTPEILQLLYELLTQPALPQDKLDIVKAQARNAIEHRDDNASSVARRELYKLLYGQDSIYARTSTLSGIASMTPSDLASFIAAWQRPDSAILGLVGDFDSLQMMGTIKQVLGPWSPASGQRQQPCTRPQERLQDLPEILTTVQGQQQQQRVIHLIDRPKAGQSSVFAGEPGLRLSDPDVYALDVLSSRLNGFGGVLFDDLRTREGLAYSVSAGWDTPVDHTGLFVAAAETGQPARFIQSLTRVLASTREQQLTADELSKAKAGLLNSFVFNFASSYSQLQRTMVYQLLGLPQDFLFEYRDRVEAVTPEQIVQAAARHLHPEKEVVVVVGDAAVVGPQLKEAGFFVQPLKPKSAA